MKEEAGLLVGGRKRSSRGTRGNERKSPGEGGYRWTGERDRENEQTGWRLEAEWEKRCIIQGSR